MLNSYHNSCAELNFPASGIDFGTPIPLTVTLRKRTLGYFIVKSMVDSGKKGIPASVYRDRHMIFEVSKRVRSTLEEDFAGSRFPTQVGRLLAELGVESIAAYSPQAKRFLGEAAAMRHKPIIFLYCLHMPFMPFIDPKS